MSVLLSSHVLAELERVADYLILMSRGRVQVAGEIDDLIAGHRILTGPPAEATTYGRRPVVHVRRGEAQAHLLGPVQRGRMPGPAGLGGTSGRPGGARARLLATSPAPQRCRAPPAAGMSNSRR